MKKKILVFAALVAFAGMITLSISAAATVRPNPECPNGCKPDGAGCYCYEWHFCLLEAQ